MKTRVMFIENSEAAGNVNREVKNLAEDPETDPSYTFDGECNPLYTWVIC